MSDIKYAYLVYQKDFSEKGKDRYFLYIDGGFSEVNSSEVFALDCYVVTHDFWLISNSLYKKHQKIPDKIIDVVLFSKIVAGIKAIDGDTQPWDISNTIIHLYKDASDFYKYVSMYYRRQPLDVAVYMLFSHKLAEYFDFLLKESAKVGEYERFFLIEQPVYNELVASACKGIRVCKDTIRDHKIGIKSQYYRELKAFAEKHGVLYEVPSDGDVSEKLISLGYDVKNYSMEYLIDFLPSRDGYTDDLRSLQKTNKSYRIFNSISANKSRIRPIVESHWTSTARIYHKSPSIQNISKHYRNIFIADEEYSLCYVDYDQFEVGVMAALSGDHKMKDIYENMDAYKNLAEHVFDNVDLRKKAKVMFLSYTYGMSLDNILSSVSELGGDQDKAKDYFSEFKVFEEWKKSVCEEFLKNGRISTINANYLNRANDGELSDKEKRTAVNHVIQGSATYIFKKALLEISKLDGVQMLIPMHDAVLFQHLDAINPDTVVNIFEEIMTSVLDGKVNGKASIESFYVS